MRAHRKPRQSRRRALQQIANPAHIQDHRILGDGIHDAGELADHRAAPRARSAHGIGQPGAGARQMRMGDGGRQRVGGIGLVHAAGGQQALDHELHLSLAGMARTHHAFLDVVRGIFRDLEPRLGRRQQRHGAGMAELQGGGRIARHKGLLHRHGRGREAFNHRINSRCSAIKRNADPGRTRGGVHAMLDMESRAPSSAITPQPMRPRPGSRPRMRIAPGMENLYPLCSGLCQSGRPDGIRPFARAQGAWRLSQVHRRSPAPRPRLPRQLGHQGIG